MWAVCNPFALLWWCWVGLYQVLEDWGAGFSSVCVLEPFLLIPTAPRPCSEICAPHDVEPERSMHGEKYIINRSLRKQLTAFTVNSLPVPLVWLYAMKDHWLCSKIKENRNDKGTPSRKGFKVIGCMTGSHHPFFLWCRHLPASHWSFTRTI